MPLSNTVVSVTVFNPLIGTLSPGLSGGFFLLCSRLAECSWPPPVQTSQVRAQDQAALRRRAVPLPTQRHGRNSGHVSLATCPRDRYDGRADAIPTLC